VVAVASASGVHPVDLEPFRAGDPADREDVARQIDTACRDTGFLLLTGHGVRAELCAAALDGFDDFFDLPDADKRRWIVPDPAANRGYTPYGQEGLAYTQGETTPPDLMEAYTVGREDAVGPFFDEWRGHFAPNVWPTEPAGLRELYLAYEAALRGVADVVLRAMAIALDLPEDWLVDRCRNAVITTRWLHYQRPTGAPDPEPGQMRLGAHTDYGVVTLLLADPVPGLQVFRRGTWHDVVVPPGALLGNIGDLLAMWTNDQWISTLHRVVPPPSSTTGPVRRRSIARFLDGDPSTVVRCIPSCCSDERPARYQPVVAGEWLHTKIVGGRTRELVELPDGGVTSADR
jgi:isopenicillin N synthase-like dioxygenase